MTTVLAAFGRLCSKRLLAACLLGFAFILPAGAASVLPLYLDEIIDRSAVAFEGVVLENRTEREASSGYVVTYTTFEVRDVLKGGVGSTHVIKQIGGTLAAEGLNYQIAGVPKFVVGESYVVFLHGVSSAGFSSPVGLTQGRFSIRQGAAGREVTNGVDFNDLLASSPEKAKAAGAKQAPGATRSLDIDAFKQLVRERAGLQQNTEVQK
jgi:hypothetical protein